MPFQNFIVIYMNSLFELTRELWLYFLLGLIISALIQEFISTKKLLKYFGGNDLASLYLPKLIKEEIDRKAVLTKVLALALIVIGIVFVNR